MRGRSRIWQWNAQQHPAPPHVLRALPEVVTHSNSVRALTDFRRELELWRQSGADRKFHLIELGFDQLEDPEERRFFQTLPISFTLPDQSVDRLREVGGRLLSQSPAFRAFRGDSESANGARSLHATEAPLASPP